MLSQALLSQVQTETGLNLAHCSISPISGGDISNAFLVKTQSAENLFIKANKVELYPMFVEEAIGLAEIESSCPFSTPKVLAHGKTATESYLALEYLEPSAKSELFWQQLGEELAQVHSKTSDSFGFESNNFIGSLPQYNSKASTWAEFFVELRLEFQVKLAFDHKLLSKNHLRKFNALYNELESIFPREKPSLVHGDLWSGNVHCSNNNAFVIDPAVYYGHREMDLAFSLMFGGFSPIFYESYESQLPLEKGFGKRVEFYNLYPTLVHLNLFGKSYLAPIENSLAKF
jgi:fructosamine-3-kinase